MANLTVDGWKPSYKTGGEDEDKWKRIVAHSNAQKKRRGFGWDKAHAQRVWKNYLGRNVEMGGGIKGPKIKGTSASDYLKEIKRRKKEKKNKK